MEIQGHLEELAKIMRENSERWFPEIHSDDAAMPLPAFYALGLTGEAGEVGNLVKKVMRRFQTITQSETAAYKKHLAEELADVFTYLILLADEEDINLMEAYVDKVEVNKRRWD